MVFNFKRLGILFFCIQLGCMAQAQKGSLVNDYFNQVYKTRPASVFVERLVSYTDQLAERGETEKLGQLAEIYKISFKNKSHDDRIIWRRALMRYADKCNKKMSDFEAALQYYLMAHELAEDTVYYDELAWYIEMEIANIYNRLGDLEATQFYQNLAQKSLQHFGKRENLSRLMVNKAQLQLDFGDKQAAYQSYKEGIKIASEINYPRGILANNINLGKLMANDHNLEEARVALKTAQKVLPLVKEQSNKYAGELKELEAIIAAAEKDYARAIGLYEQAEREILIHYKNNGKRRELAKLSIERIKAAFKSKSYHRAIYLSDSILQVFLPGLKENPSKEKSDIYPDNIFVDLFLLRSKSYYALGKLDAAVFSLDKAIYANDLLRNEYLDSPSRLVSVALNKDLVGYGLDLLFEKSKKTDQQVDSEKVLTFFKAAKGRLLAQKTEEGEALKIITQESRQKLKILEEKMAMIYKDGVETDEEKNQLSKLKIERRKLIHTALEKNKISTENKAKNSIQYAFSQNHLYRFSRVNGIEIFERTGSRQEAWQLTQSIRNAIQNQKNTDSLFKEGYQFFMGRLGHAMPDELLILPDEILYELPFDVLKDSSGRYVIESTKIWYDYKDNLIKRKTNFSQVDMITPKYKGALEIKATDFEEEEIKRYYTVRPFNGEYSKILVRDFLKGSVPLHYAGHADNENETAYLQVTEKEKIYDYEISNFQNNRPFVFLSACNTGLGQLEKGEGLRSLCKSFLEAGVPSVIHSLWEINDQSYSKITSQFYRFLKDGKTGTEALRDAKLQYLSSANLQQKNPYYWAAFVYTGDDIQVQKFNVLKYAYILLGLAGILFITYLIKRK